jgi:uncharacterized membrane protein
LKKKLWITAISLLLLNILLKVIFISSESIAWDEPFSIYHAQMSVKNIIHQLYLGNNPPFFELILHFWIKMFGISPFSVRFLPMIFSSLTAVMIFLLGNKMFHFKVGLFTALLFTFSKFNSLKVKKIENIFGYSFFSMRCYFTPIILAFLFSRFKDFQSF